MLGAEALRMAVSSLWHHKLRSAMVILGVVIGVGSVLTVTTLGAAFERSITSEFDELDDRSIFVGAQQAGFAVGPPDAGQFGRIFTDVDRRGLVTIPGVERVSAAGSVSVSSVRVDNKTLPFQNVQATTADAEEVRDPTAYANGGAFTDGEAEAVLGYTIAAFLGGGTPVSVGDGITITFTNLGTRSLTVAGVLAEQEALFGTVNGQIFVPVEPFYTHRDVSPTSGERVPFFEGFTVIAARGADIEEVRNDVLRYMAGQSDARRLLVKDVEIFVTTASGITEAIGSAFSQVTLFVAGIAGVSLLVSGIMIATIMLIAVTERTKEIGMMKAIGALDREVLWLFLFEASLVGLFGSIIGIAAGLAGGAFLIQALFADGDVAFAVPWPWVGISVLVGVGVGLVAGLLPARRALRISPVEALSYD